MAIDRKFLEIFSKSNKEINKTIFSSLVLFLKMKDAEINMSDFFRVNLM